MNAKYLIYPLIIQLIVYAIAYQLYFFAGFNSVESIVTRPLLNILVVMIIVTNIAYIFYYHSLIKSNKVIWLIYMFVTNGIGSIHYYYKHRKNVQKNT